MLNLFQHLIALLILNYLKQVQFTIDYGEPYSILKQMNDEYTRRQKPKA